MGEKTVSKQTSLPYIAQGYKNYLFKKFMGQTSQVVRKALYALGSFGISFFSEMKIPGISATFLTVIGNIFSNFTSDIIKDLRNDILDRLQKSPTVLNYHLHTLFIEELQAAISQGVLLSYEKERNIKLGNERNILLKKLGAEFELAFNVSAGNTLTIAELTSLLLEENNFEAFQSICQEKMLSEFDPMVFFSENNFPADFTTYFRNNLLPVFRILFMERLNSNRYEKARLAYERMMAEETYKGVQAMLQLSKYSSKLENYSSTGSQVDYQKAFANSTREALLYFEAGLDRQLQLAKDTNIRVIRLDGKTDRIEKGVNRGNKLLYSVIAMIIIVAGCFFSFYRSKTFHATIELRDEDNKTLSQGNISLEYGTKKDKAYLNNDGTAVFAQIPAYFENDSAEVILDGELENIYEILPGSKKVPLVSDRIIHVRVVKRKQEKPPGQTPAPVAGIIATRDKAGIKKRLNEEKHDEPSPPDVIVKLGGVTFTDEKSPDYIIFTRSGSNNLAFDGKVGIRPISGTVRFKNDHLEIDRGNVRGQFNLRDDNTALTGSVTIIETNTLHKIEMKSN